MFPFDFPGVASAVKAAASVGSGKSEAAVMADPKPNFGDKQKPLFSVPLKWRKLVGKPQVGHTNKTIRLPVGAGFSLLFNLS